MKRRSKVFRNLLRFQNIKFTAITTFQPGKKKKAEVQGYKQGFEGIRMRGTRGKEPLLTQ